ncbi:DUF1292 domain-containing protein [Fournierella massiliensis]|nr:DUF1292 domain-containing protein [Fournierella massiliensis]MCF2556922.1 DUF1292 domain-containing protein [Fournierella massiliensis]
MEEELEQGADIIVLKDEEGRDVRFEFLDLLEYDGEEYVILMQEDDDSGEVVILRLEGEDEEGGGLRRCGRRGNPGPGI